MFLIKNCQRFSAGIHLPAFGALQFTIFSANAADCLQELHPYHSHSLFAITMIMGIYKKCLSLNIIQY